MTRPRSQIVSLAATPYYHCVSRCVRRAFLCGEDRYSGQNFDHRKQWLVDRLYKLAEVFAIDIAAYAVMSNHYHVVLHVDHARSRCWNRDEVIRRWLCLYRGDPLVHRYLDGTLCAEAEYQQLDQLVALWRERLTSLSWFMRCLNEYLARRANQEDGCTGRFWEGRFTSQALLDEAALLSCMTYVDLNPVRAGLCDTLQDSAFTSVQARIRWVAERTDTSMQQVQTPGLMPLRTAAQSKPDTACLPFALQEYLALVDWTGRMTRPDKKASLAQDTPALLATLHLNTGQWRMLALEIQQQAITMFHGLNKLATTANRRTRKAA